MTRILADRLAAGFAMLATAGLLVACDKTTTTAQTPAGTVTTTTISPSPAASAVIGKINDSMADAASAVESGAAASQALAKASVVVEDGLITAKVKTALLADPDIRGLHVEVETRDGAVKLSGTVDKAGSIERAARIARDTKGVKSVDNQIVVKTSA